MTGSRFVITPAGGVGPQRPAMSTPDRAAGSVRRTSNIDVMRPEGATGTVEITAAARDLATAADGGGRVPATRTITQARATPRVLPYVECPAAAESAARLAGLELDEVRDRVRNEFTGTTTCTHLNDLLRGLEDVRGMLSVAVGS